MPKLPKDLLKRVRRGAAAFEQHAEHLRDHGFDVNLRSDEYRHLETSRKVKKGQTAGHESSHGTTEEKQARWASYQADLDSTITRNPALSLTEARRRTAEKHDVSLKTIARHTTDPRKK